MPCPSLRIDRHHIHTMIFMTMVLCVSILGQACSVKAFADEGKTLWRKTTMGWEEGKPRPQTLSARNSTQAAMAVEFFHVEPPIPTPTLNERLHRCALPAAIAMLLACLGPLMLIALPSAATSETVVHRNEEAVQESNMILA